MSAINDIEIVDRLVKENHNLIYSFAHSHFLNLEEYYDLLAISLVNAARTYQEDRGTTFSTLCYTIMENDCKQYLRKKGRDLLPRCDSLDVPIKSGDEKLKYIDMIGSVDFNDLKLILSSPIFIKTLSQKEKHVLLARLENKTQEAIAKELKVSQTEICRILYNLKRKISKIL